MALWLVDSANVELSHQVRPLYSITKTIKEDGSVTVNPRNLANVHPSFDFCTYLFTRLYLPKDFL